jgi:peroxiredoxin
VLVDAAGAIASPVASGADAIEAWIESALSSPAAAAPPAVQRSDARLRPGDDAPEFALPSLDGPALRLADLRGVETLLLFWNAACGFCQELIEPLKALELSDAAATRRLVIVARDDARATGAAGFRSMVLADVDARLSKAFGAHGTPMAVLLDPRGRVASDLAIGARAVLELAGHATVVAPGRGDPASASSPAALSASP